MVLSRLRRFLIEFVVISLVILFLPGLPPFAEFESIQFAAPPALSGPLASNGRLEKVERWLDGMVHGPESVAIWDDIVYTGIQGGLIVRVDAADKAHPVARVGEPCDTEHGLDAPRCGRPLGMRFDRSGQLIVADAYRGILKVNVQTGDVETVVPGGEAIDGRPLRITNDVDIGDNGVLYFTSSSSASDLHDGYVELFSNGTGRLFRWDPATKQIKILMTGLSFANGVALSKAKDYLLVAETGKFRVHRLWLKGDKAGVSEILLDNLPGYPDNIRQRPKGGFYIGLCNLRQENSLIERVKSHGLLVKFLVRLLSLTMTPIKLVERFFPNMYSQTILYKMVTLESLSGVVGSGAPVRGMVLEVSEKGKLVGSLHTQDISCISQMTEHKGALYAASPYNHFLGYRPA